MPAYAMRSGGYDVFTIILFRRATERSRTLINNNNNNKSSATVAVKQTLGRQVGQVREHECNMHVCVGVGSHWLKLLQTILLF